jgi:hypothetical protein
MHRCCTTVQGMPFSLCLLSYLPCTTWNNIQSFGKINIKFYCVDSEETVLLMKFFPCDNGFQNVCGHQHERDPITSRLD